MNPIGENKDAPSEYRCPDDKTEHSEQPILPTTTEFEPPPPTTHCDKTSEQKKHWLDYTTFGLELLGFAVLCMYAAFSIKIYCTNKDAADAAKSAAETARKTLELSNRPWISADLSIRRQIALEGTIVSVVVGVTLKNTGHSPALNIRKRTELVAHGSDAHGFHISEDVKRCVPLKESPGSLGFTVFPGDTLEVTPDTIISTDVRPVADGSDILFTVVTCIDYQFSFSVEHHQTAYVSMIGSRTEAALVTNDSPGVFRLLTPRQPSSLTQTATTAN